MKDKHCKFARLNSHGKCIAVCHHSQKTHYQEDCIGNKHVNNMVFNEAQVTGTGKLSNGERVK